MPLQGVDNLMLAVASMKVPPKRKGNDAATSPPSAAVRSLNESPSEKEGKCARGVFEQ